MPELPIHAEQRFQKGDRVKPSAKGREQLGMKEDRRGTVVGFSRDGQGVYVASDRAKTGTAYHHTFWEKADA